MCNVFSVQLIVVIKKSLIGKIQQQRRIIGPIGSLLLLFYEFNIYEFYTI